VVHSGPGRGPDRGGPRGGGHGNGGWSGGGGNHGGWDGDNDHGPRPGNGQWSGGRPGNGHPGGSWYGNNNYRPSGWNNYPGNRYPGNRYYPGFNYGNYGYGYGRNYGYGNNLARLGLGLAFGQYGYSPFPWYGGLGGYRGGYYGGLGYGGSGYNRYTTGYRGSYNNGVVVLSEAAPARSTVESQTAIPADQDYVPQLNKVMAQLGTSATGGAALGITLDPEYPNVAVVRTVTPGGAAATAGLQPGDMITSIDQKQIGGFNDVVGLIATMQPQAQVEIQFGRPILRSQVQAAAPIEQPTVPAQAVPTEALPAQPSASTPPAPPTAQPTLQ
jgi:hypothetical protein